MKVRQLIASCLVLGCTCAVGLAVTWTWCDHIDDPGDHDKCWKGCENWCGRYLPWCFPKTPGDDARIRPKGETWRVDLITVTIDDLTIESSVDFGKVNVEPTLSVDTLHVAGGDTTATTATLGEGGRIETY